MPITRDFASLAGAILAASCLGLFSTWLFYPGFMSFDSIIQYRQVIGELGLTNYHPPVVVYLWRLADALAGPGGLLIIHQALYWAGVAMLALCLSDRLWVRLLVITGLGLLPPLWSHSALLLKDAAVLTAFLFAYSCCLAARQFGLRWLILLALLALFYGLAARRTSVLAAMPLFLLAAAAWRESVATPADNAGGRSPATWKLAGMWIAGVLAAAILVSTVGVKKTTKWTTVAIWDLAAVSLSERVALIPRTSWLYPGESQEQHLARLEEWFNPFLNVRVNRVASLSPVADNDVEILTAWLSLPLAYPGSYFGHRSRLYKRLLGVDPEKGYLAYGSRIYPNDLGLQLQQRDTTLFKSVRKGLRWSRDTVLFQPWLYLLVLIAAALPAARRGATRSFEALAMACLSVSGLLYILPMYFAAPAADFRYTLWAVACAVIVVCIISTRWNSRNQGPE